MVGVRSFGVSRNTPPVCSCESIRHGKHESGHPGVHSVSQLTEEMNWIIQVFNYFWKKKSVPHAFGQKWEIVCKKVRSKDISYFQLVLNVRDTILKHINTHTTCCHVTEPLMKPLTGFHLGSYLLYRMVCTSHMDHAFSRCQFAQDVDSVSVRSVRGGQAKARGVGRCVLMAAEELLRVVWKIHTVF